MPHPTFKFLRLPLEIRQRIYTHLAPPACAPHLSDDTDWEGPWNRRGRYDQQGNFHPGGLVCAILQTNHQIHDEALPFFYQTLVFTNREFHYPSWSEPEDWAMVIWVDRYLAPYDRLGLIQTVVVPFYATPKGLRKGRPGGPYARGVDVMDPKNYILERGPTINHYDSVLGNKYAWRTLISHGLRPRSVLIDCQTDIVTGHSQCGGVQNDCKCLEHHEAGDEGCDCVRGPTASLIRHVLEPLQPLDEIIVEGRQINLKSLLTNAEKWGMQTEIRMSPQGRTEGFRMSRIAHSDLLKPYSVVPPVKVVIDELDEESEVESEGSVPKKVSDLEDEADDSDLADKRYGRVLESMLILILAGVLASYIIRAALQFVFGCIW